MNVFTPLQKKITANVNGCIIAAYTGINNSVSFLAELPQTAVVDHIKVDGKFLEDIVTKKVRYHLEPAEGKYKVVATVEFEDYDLELYDKLANYVVQDFEVYYHHEIIEE